MPDGPDGKIGFFVWNPFQVFQVRTIAKQLPQAEFLLHRRNHIDTDRLFPDEFLNNLETPVRTISNEYFAADCPDHAAIVCQSPFANMEKLEDTKLIGMQYSMAKERHQYGPWRALCDMTLVYGQYSHNRISLFSPCVMVGNPRFDPWFANQEAYPTQTSADGKQTVLYLPTWSNYSSVSVFVDAISNLSNMYRVITKSHHLTDIYERKRSAKLANINQSEFYGAADDLLPLLAQADVVLCDYSGAIFDAINVGKPVILLQHNIDELASSDRLGKESIEVYRRDEIGPVVDNPDKLQIAISDVLSYKTNFIAENDKLRKECFSQTKDCGKAAADTIINFMANPISRPWSQIYLRDELRRNFGQRTKNNKQSISQGLGRYAAERFVHWRALRKKLIE